MEFRFKLAPIREAVQFRVSDDRVEQLGPSGEPVNQIALSDVKTIRWQLNYVKPMITRVLELRSDRKKVAITQTATALADRRDPDVAAYLSCVHEVASRLSETRPELKIEPPPRFLRWFRFFAFVAVAAILLVPLNGVLSRRDASDLWWLTVILGACIAVSLFLAFINPPWKKLKPTPIGDLVADLRQELGRGR